MPETPTMLSPFKPLTFSGVVTQVISPLIFVCPQLAGQGDQFFQSWDIYVVRKSDGTGAAPQNDKVQCDIYTSASGTFTQRDLFSGSPVAVGDMVYLMHPFFGENTYIVDQPSDNLKQSDDTEITTVALAYTLVKSLPFTGRLGGARIKFDIKVDNIAGTASYYIAKNGVPIVTNSAATPNYTVYTDNTAIYHTVQQDIGGLIATDLIQVYALVNAGPRIAYIKNFRIYYDVVALPAVQELVTKIYYDPVYGVAGTDDPIGSNGRPSNNMTDLKAICLTRGVKNIHIKNNVTINIDFPGYTFWGDNDWQNTQVNINNGIDLTGTTFHGLALSGGIPIGLIYCMDCELGTVAFGPLSVNLAVCINCLVVGISTTTSGVPGQNVTLYGCFTDSSIGGYVDISAFGQINAVDFRGILAVNMHNALSTFECVGNNCHIGFVDMGGGRAYLWGTMSYSNPGTIFIYDARINAGILHEQSSAAINTTATNAAETNVLNLAASVGVHYMVRWLTLKSVDPGANTVTVRLYALVNGVLTQINSFAITTANYTTYFNLVSMFGVQYLTDDSLRVTVRASAGGPYAVTGQYAYAITQ